MVDPIRAVIRSYDDLMNNKSDPRVKDWFMMSGPIPTLLLCSLYLYFVKGIGPKMMEKRKPFQLRRIIIFYNLFQVLLSAWLFYETMASGWWRDYSYRCQPVDWSTRPKAMRMAAVSWWYLMSKFTEFLDTIFFVLRKKNHQVSTLHIIHHVSMPIATWFGVKFSPGGHPTFFGLLNTFVHIIMYGYYFLAALGPKVQPYLWWKKYLTALQMIQFMAVLIHEAQLFFIECDVSMIFPWLTVTLAVLFLYLFGKFYIETYNKIEKQSRVKQNTD